MPFIREKTSRGLLWLRLNTPYKWYKIYVHSLFNPPLVQAVAYPAQGVLGGAYPSHGLLPWMWSYNGLKCCLWLAETMNDCCACSVFNYIPDLHSWETSAAVVGKWAAAWENRKFSLNSTLSLCIPRHLFQATRLIADELSQQPNPNLEWNVNWKWKRI